MSAETAPRPRLRVLPTLATGALLIVLALVAVGGSLSGAAQWSPDGLFYQARSVELRGTPQQAALDETFQGPLAADLRRIDPEHTGSRAWVNYNAQFYERRVAVPLAGAALHSAAGDRALLDISLAGYLAAVLALFGLLLLRFRLAIAGVATAATIFLPALVHHASYPLTDSWGLALETAAFAAAILTLERGRRWLVLWAALLLVLTFTRDTAYIPILAALGFAVVRRRSADAWLLAGIGLLALAPVALMYPMPIREVLAFGLNGFQAPADPSWSFIAGRYPHALTEYLRADGGFVRRGEWYSAAYLLGGLALLFGLGFRERARNDVLLLWLGAAAGIAYLLSAPIFSGLRLELVLVPMAAFGLALGAERLLQLAGGRRRTRSEGRRTPTADPLQRAPHEATAATMSLTAARAGAAAASERRR